MMHSALGTTAIRSWVCEIKIQLIHPRTSLTFPCSIVKMCSLSYGLALQAIAFFCLYQFGSYVLGNTNIADPK